MKATKQDSISSRARAFAVATLLVVCLLCVFATTARGDALAAPTSPVAREHYTTGNRLYRVREFEDAIEEYKAGALREGAPVFHFNLGQCYRQLGRHEEALWHYERFLQRGKPTGEVEQVTRKFIDQMRSELEKKAMKQPIEPAAPARPTVTASSGHPVGLHAEDRRGMTSQRKLAVGIGVVGVTVMGVGVGLGLRARSFKDDAAVVCPMNPCARSDEANDLVNRGKTNALYANVAFGIGGAAILGTAVLWITGSQAERKTTAIVPRVSRTFAGVAASLRF